MEKEYTCKRLEAIYQEDKVFLGGPHNACFTINKTVPITVDIKQCGIRRIVITTENEITEKELYKVLTNIERLLMLFEGRFFNLSELIFLESEEYTEIQLTVFAQHMMNLRLSYFKSADFCKVKTNVLIKFDSIISEELYKKWESLIDELDVVNQIYLYALSDSGMPIDLKCAFLIELCEPLIEVVKEHKNFFSSLTPGERGTTLKNCIDALITKYGTVIFSKELAKCYEQVLTALVNSRNRIMHIKRKQKKMYLGKNESIIYINKISLLYRHIILQILGVEQAIYQMDLSRCVKTWDEWNDSLKQFLNAITVGENTK